MLTSESHSMFLRCESATSFKEGHTAQHVDPVNVLGCDGGAFLGIEEQVMYVSGAHVDGCKGSSGGGGSGGVACAATSPSATTTGSTAASGSAVGRSSGMKN